MMANADKEPYVHLTVGTWPHAPDPTIVTRICDADQRATSRAWRALARITTIATAERIATTA